MRLEKSLTVLAVAMLGAALLPAQNQVTLTVDATMDVYRAGGYIDGSDGIEPVVFTFRAGTYQSLTFPSAGGGWSCQNGYPDYGPDGEMSGYCFGGPGGLKSIGPLSGYGVTDFTGALVGIFLEDSLPAVAPAALRFYVSNASEGGIQTNFPRLGPEVGQMFFIGDGLTGTDTGTIQTFVVPPTATSLPRLHRHLHGA